MKRIIVIDDDQDLVRLVKLSLEGKGYTVKGISEGSQIMQSITNFSPDLILLDVNLGEHNGIDICKEIKENINTNHIKIIIFSTHHKRIDSLNECDVLGFIRKPFYIAELHEMIEKAIDN